MSPPKEAGGLETTYYTNMSEDTVTYQLGSPSAAIWIVVEGMGIAQVRQHRAHLLCRPENRRHVFSGSCGWPSFILKAGPPDKRGLTPLVLIV